MKYYGLSKQKVTGIIRRPDRVEKGIAGNGTIAVMQAVSPKMIDGKKVWKQEVWTMYQRTKNNKQKTINEEQKTANNNRQYNDGHLEDEGRLLCFGGDRGIPTSIEHFKEVLRKKSCTQGSIKIISAWRYPGVSPKNSPLLEAMFEEAMEPLGA